MEEALINLLSQKYDSIYIKAQSVASLKRIYDLYDQDILFEPTDYIEMNYLGHYYFHQDDVPNTLKYYNMAADLGDSIAMINLGRYYLHQDDIPNMLKYYSMAADLRNIIAMNDLGCYYQKQNDVPNMLKYYSMAADLGHIASMDNLGYYYFSQNDVPNMLKYYTMAINLGHVVSMNSLGFYYEKQNDVPNMLKYYTMAADLGDIYALKIIKNYYNEHNQYAEAVIFFYKYSKIDMLIPFLEKLVNEKKKNISSEILDIIESMNSDVFKNTSCGLRTIKQLLSQKIDMMHLHFEYSENGKGFQEAREDFINHLH